MPISSTSVAIQDDLEFLGLINGSSLSMMKITEIALSILKTLKVTDSTIQSNYDIGIHAITKSSFVNATIKQSDSRLTESNTFYLNGIDGFSPSTKATVTFSGSNVFESRIDPAGKDIGIPVGISTGVSTYADSIYFTRYGDFTDETSSVNGLTNLRVELTTFARGLTADDYAKGGANSDGVYDVLFFNQGNTATTDATADSDMIAVRLGGICLRY